MANKEADAVNRYRRRRKNGGIVRLELQSHKEDVETFKTLARALLRPGKEGVRVRKKLREWIRSFAEHEPLDFKTWLLNAPLAGLDIERDRKDLGRDLDL